MVMRDEGEVMIWIYCNIYNMVMRRMAMSEKTASNTIATCHPHEPFIFSFFWVSRLAVVMRETATDNRKQNVKLVNHHHHDGRQQQ